MVLYFCFHFMSSLCGRNNFNFTYHLIGSIDVALPHHCDVRMLVLYWGISFWVSRYSFKLQVLYDAKLEVCPCVMLQVSDYDVKF
jgi:hypothetical protein